MATLDQKIENFRTKYNLNEDATSEMLSIFNEAFIELAHKLLRNQDVKKPQTKINNKDNGSKKFATKIAAEYAAEKGFTIDDFDKEKITKKDIDALVKNRESVSSITTKKIEPEEEPTIPKLMTDMCKEIRTKKKIQEKCKGINKDGSRCEKIGEQKPENCKNFYCFRHALDWKKYEVSSDSELEEEEHRDLAIISED